MQHSQASSAGCPDACELADFVTGNLSGRAFQRVAQHVEVCGVCEASLGRLDDPTDSFLGRVREIAAAEVPATEPVPPDLLAVASSCGKDRPALGPRRLGKFELLEELGFGSFGQVYRARDTELGRTVAIKMLRAGGLASREEVERLVREACSAAQLHHPGLVALHETGETEEGLFYLVEEFVPGQTLSARLKAGHFGFRQAAEWIANVADALDYAHRHGVIHRDVK